jgi:hypothetical protein
MSPVKTLGLTADPEELREVAALADAGPSPELSRRLAALPRCALTPETLASPPDVIAEHARGTALFLELRRDGVPYGSPEAREAYARLRATFRDRPPVRLPVPKGWRTTP